MKIKITAKQNIYQQILKTNTHLSAFCGGQKRCGKCKIKLINGSLPITTIEKEKLSNEELNNNIRLACCQPNCDKEVVIEVLQDEKSFDILGVCSKDFFVAKPQTGVYIAIDIGTTTIVIAFIDGLTGKIIDEAKFINPQRNYGADVLSRIDASNKLGISKLRDPLIKEIENNILYFLTNHSLPILKMVVVGNAVMTHLFMNIDPSSIALAPYICKEPNGCKLTSTSVFSNLNNEFIIEVLPPISAFVGADISAGLYYLNLNQDSTISLLVDLGTNGEIVLFDGTKFYTTAAAAGPAFEGGNMSCGIGSIAGAICEAKFEKEWVLKTINQQPAIGICGSGYIQIISEMARLQLFDSSGFLKQNCLITPSIYVNKTDIRNFQLAKSAVRTAIEIICNAANITPENIKTVYLAGGLGNAINTNDLIKLNILPNSFANKIKVVGNTALLGAIQYLLDNDENRINYILSNYLSFNLSTDENFIDLFAEYMSF